MQDVIIGAGEIGTSLSRIYKDARLVDKPPHSKMKAEVMHICFPYSEESFVDNVNKYQKHFDPEATIIHSTVAVGVTSRIASAVHSPCFGKHPNLTDHLLTYPKLIGGENDLAEKRLRDKFKIKVYDQPETTELLKLLSTTHYGLQIAWAQEVERILKKWDVSFDEYLSFTHYINRGLEDIGNTKAKRSMALPGKIEGHCVMPNLKILKEQFVSDFFDAIKDSNENY